MEALAQAEGLTISQQMDWSEMVWREKQNAYQVADSFGRPVCYGIEEPGSFFSMWSLKHMRPFNLNVFNMSAEPIHRFQRPFRFFKHVINISTGDSAPLGSVEREWSFFQRIYVLRDTEGSEIARLKGGMLWSWTYKLYENRVHVGAIKKRLGGLTDLISPDCDNYTVDFPHDADLQYKALLLTAAIRIDYCHYEKHDD